MWGKYMPIPWILWVLYVRIFSNDFIVCRFLTTEVTGNLTLPRVLVSSTRPREGIQSQWRFLKLLKWPTFLYLFRLPCFLVFASEVRDSLRSFTVYCRWMDGRNPWPRLPKLPRVTTLMIRGRFILRAIIRNWWCYHLGSWDRDRASQRVPQLKASGPLHMFGL